MPQMRHIAMNRAHPRRLNAQELDVRQEFQQELQ
jgi:hypothetical protein